MRGFLAVFRRELAAYFGGPLGYVVAIAYLVASSFLFVFYDLFRDNQASLRAFFEKQPAILSILGPLVGMRLWAEERRTGTLETLLTLPVGRIAPVAGKFAAGWAFVGICVVLTFPLPLALALLVSPDSSVDWGVLLSGYAGVLVLGGFCLALGGLASARTRDQIVAAVAGTVAGLALWLLSLPITVSSLDAFGARLGPAAGLGEAAGQLSHGAHLGNVARGLFDLGDAAYFALATGFLLWLTGLSLEAQRLGVRSLSLAVVAGGRIGLSRRTRAHAATLLAGTLLILGCAVLLQRAAAATGIQADLTEERVFTLSEATGRILGSLRDPVKVTWYVSERLPTAMRDLPRRTADRLERMRRLAPDRFRFEIVHPERDGKVRARLQEDRVSPIPIREESFEEATYREIYSHLAVTYLDRPPYYLAYGQDEELEYSLLRAVQWLRLGRETPRLAAIVPPPHGETGGIVVGQVPAARDPFERILNYLSASFRVERLDARERSEIPEGTQALLIVKPDPLAERWRWQVERFLAEGGTVLAFVPGIHHGFWQVEYQQTWKAEETLADLLAPLGVSLPPLFLSDNVMHRHVVNTESGYQAIPMPLVPLVAPDQLDAESPLTRSLGGLIVPFATPILLQDAALRGAGIRATVLATTSNQSCARPLVASPYTPKIWESYSVPPRREEWRRGEPVAVLLEGKFPFPFRGRPVPGWPAPSPPPRRDGEGAVRPREEGPMPPPPPDPLAGTVPEIRSRPGRLLLVSCAEMISSDFLDRFQAEYEATNVEFLENALMAFTLGDDLLQIRRKAYRNRPLREVEPPRFVDFVVAPIGAPPATTADLRQGRALLVVFSAEAIPKPLLGALAKAAGTIRVREPDPEGRGSREEDRPGVRVLELFPEDVSQEQIEAMREDRDVVTAPEPRGARAALGAGTGSQALYVDRFGEVVYSGPLRSGEELLERVRGHRAGEAAPRGARKLALQALLVAGSPALLAAFGILQAIVGRRARRRYERRFGL